MESYYHDVMMCDSRTGKAICGARTRKGAPCQRTRLMLGGRCRCHGGMSTGPKTPEGLQRAIQAMHDVRHTPEGRQAHSARMRAAWADPRFKLRVIAARLHAQDERDFQLVIRDRFNPERWDWFDARRKRRHKRLTELQLEATSTPPFIEAMGRH